MYKEQSQHSNINKGTITSTHAGLLKVEDAKENGFPNFDPGLDGMQMVLRGMNTQNKLTSIIPIVLSNDEMDTAQSGLKGYNEICHTIEENYSSDLLNTKVN